ncbi:methyl-accepting chemotaxis protein [Nocardioides sp. AE5]|uniref:methyl-accepting chemotaxis protein n=1 Tax=Nocardioides sp. AE5 TaxID=2962573 RepID=UPI0028817B55|nr:methyl-accepting chemotaxis protein [Nocardioides sp. AE5]MDT0200825.1 methyl-accepting chemotaxis protein [Nocardioides sp. AE5]
MTDLEIAPSVLGAGSDEELTERGESTATAGRATADRASLVNGSVEKAAPHGDPFSQVRSVLDGLAARVFLVDVDKRIRYANDKAVEKLRPLEAFLPVSVDELVGADITPFFTLLGTDPDVLASFWDVPDQLPYATEVQVGGETADLVISAVRDNGTFTGAMVSWVGVTDRVVADEERSRAERERNEAAADTAAVNKVLTGLSAATSVERAVQVALDTVRDEFGWAYGSYWTVDVESQELCFSLESGDAGPEFREVTLAASFPEGVGLSGRTWAARELVFTPDIGQVTDCVRAPVAQRVGVRSGVCFPIIVDDRVIATMDFFATETLEPSEQRLEALRNVGRLVSAAVERIERESADRAASAELARKVDLVLEVVRAAEAGDLTRQVPVSGEDAIGQLAAGLGSLLGKLRRSMDEIGRTADSLAVSSEQLTILSQGMGEGAASTSERAGSASSASVQVSASIQTVASAAEEMTASIREIAKNATDAATVATSAVQVASSAQETVTSLGESSAEIGQVIKVITSIAQQTNLLALNATIEAARAGDAGKGFAVVANEVKELAKETARATEDISQKIVAIQGDTEGAVAAIAEISEVIGRINDIQASIASAVEEQTATTNEIARSVTEAATGANGIAEDVTQVARAADDTSQGAQNTLASATGLAGIAAELRQLVGQFEV